MEKISDLRHLAAFNGGGFLHLSGHREHLEQSRQKLTGLSVSSRGVQNTEYPEYFTEIHLFYSIRGKNLDASRVERAMKLSEEKYCSVGATESGRSKIYIEYKIEQEE